MKKILILGGTGLQAESATLDLLEMNSDLVGEITLASRNTEALKKRVAKISNPKVNYETVDICDHDAVVKLMKRYDLVLNAAASPTIGGVVQAALHAGVDLLGLADIATGGFEGVPANECGFVTEEFLDRIDEDYKKAGCTCCLGWGYVPGITNVFGRMIGDKFDTINSMNWYYATVSVGDKVFFSEAPKEMAMLFNHECSPIFRDGKYVFINPKEDRVKIQFPEPFGEIVCQHMPFMSIVRVFQERYASKNIQNIDVYLGYWPGYMEKMDFLNSVGLLDMRPKDINGVKVAPYDVFLAGPGVSNTDDLKNVKDYGIVRLVADGTINGKQVSYTADAIGRPIRNLGAMQILTGIPAAIGIQMYLKGEITKKGFYTTQDDAVSPIRYLEELGRRGYKVTVTSTETEVIVDGGAQ